MPVTIHADPPLAPTSEMCLDVVQEALADTRPASDACVVMIVGADQDVTHFEFRRSLPQAAGPESVERHAIRSILSRWGHH
jgi:hypothetical protein